MVNNTYLEKAKMLKLETPSFKNETDTHNFKNSFAQLMNLTTSAINKKVVVS